MQTKEITYEEFCLFVQGGCVMSKGIKDEWDGSRHYDYIVSLECHKKTNGFQLQYVATEKDGKVSGVDVLITDNDNKTNAIQFARL